MKVRRISDLIDWTRVMHQQLAARLADGAAHNEHEVTRLLLSYFSDHETALSETIEGFEQQGDAGALNTWVYDYLQHEAIDLKRVSEKPFAEMAFEEICGTVFDAHNQAIGLYRDLLGRANNPEAQELLKALLDIEEHETMRLAQQSNRVRDM